MSRDLAADAEDAKTQGNAALANKDFDNAIKWYSVALDHSKRLPQPNNRHVYFSNRSAAYLSKGYADSALKDAITCIETNPTWPKGYGRKGAALHAQKKYDEAIAAYEQGLQVAPGDEALKQGLAQVQADKTKPFSPFASAGGADDGVGGLATMFQDPDALNRLRAHPKTKAYMEDAKFVKLLEQLASQPQLLSMLIQADKRIMQCVGVLLGVDLEAASRGGENDDQEDDQARTERMRQQKQAEEEEKKRREEEEERVRRENETPEERAARESKERAAECKERGNAHYKKKEFDMALKAYDEAVALDAANMTYHLNKASVYLEMKDLEHCLQACDQAIEVGRQNHASYESIAKALERRGNAYFKHDMVEDALREYKRAQIEFRSSEIEDKIRKCERLVKQHKEKEYVDPAKAVEAKERGNAKFKAGDFAGSVTEYSEAILRDPACAVYRVNRAAALTKLTDFGRALEDAEKACELDPKYIKAYARKGKIEQATKKYHRALDSFKKGLELDPNDAECSEGLQQVLTAIRSHSADEGDDKLRSARALEDPEIRAIMTDPVMAQVLRDLSQDPKAARHHLQNADIRAKLDKLIAAGIVKTS
jgi:stress-induced-phosphoprotein 1